MGSFVALFQNYAESSSLRFEELIHSNHWDQRIPRVVVTTRTGEWDLYFEAVAKGAFDVIRSPWYAADVEMAVLRALRENGLYPSQASE